MNQQQLKKEIEKDLLNLADLIYKKGCQRFFKEKVKNMGVRVPDRRKIAKKYWQIIKNWEKKEILDLAEELLKRDLGEYRTIAFQWSFELKNRFEKVDFNRWERWIDDYTKNWGAVDDFCTHSLGYFLVEFPQFLKEMNNWAKSKNRWKRRATAVSLIYGVRRKTAGFLDQIFEVAEILLKDEDDLVQKGYGWALKEASNNYQRQVWNWVMKGKENMPRTTLRYAVEKMSKELKTKVMN
ncbi:DNA alkylation repair protein [Candidatus Shapirobacteria bacterium]|nr:MAG: DNA alkylation repair protein [Candidatus Shapirobacteria bacterium]